LSNQRQTVFFAIMMSVLLAPTFPPEQATALCAGLHAKAPATARSSRAIRRCVRGVLRWLGAPMTTILRFFIFGLLFITRRLSRHRGPMTNRYYHGTRTERTLRDLIAPGVTSRRSTTDRRLIETSSTNGAGSIPAVRPAPIEEDAR
jgi:hypothetical protein